MKKELSSRAIHRLIEKSGVVRVGEDAVNELKEILENFALKIGREALELASHAGRKTVRAEDIKLALKSANIKLETF